MDDFRAIPQMAEALQEMVAKGHARLATVVAVYPNEVDASLSDGSVARFATTHNGLAVGQKGVLIVGMGGAKIFTPLGVIVPKPTMNGSFPAVTLSTAGTYQHNETAVLMSGMVPGETYTALITAQVIVFTTGTANSRFRFGYTVTDYDRTNSWSGTDVVNAPLASGANQRLLQTSTYSHTVRARTDGTILLTPAIQWVAGTLYWQWHYLTVTMF